MNDPLEPSDDGEDMQALQAKFTEAMLLAAAEADAPPALRARVLERVRDAQRAPDHTLTIHADEGRWKPVLPGIHMKMLHHDPTGRSFLLRLDPGAVLPGHLHDGDEECLVLSGDLYLGDFRVGAGGYHLARTGSRHGDIHAPDGALIFLRSNVSVHYDAGR